MSDKALGWWYVTGQFLLLILLVLSPGDKAGYGPIDAVFAILGYLVMVAGTVLLVVAARGLGRSLTAHPSPRDRSQLVTDGLYHYVRHPIYSALMMLALGVTLQSGPYPQVVAFAALVLLLNFKARFEEQQLLERYPDYADYAARTPRFIPRPQSRR